MAALCPASQWLLIVLLCSNVGSVPVKNDMYWSDAAGGLMAPKGGSGSLPGGHASDVQAVPSAYAAYAPGQYAAGSVQDVHQQVPGGWNAAAVSGPAQAASGLPSAASGINVSPEQHSYVGGHLDKYVANFEHGGSQRQTEETGSLLPLPQLPRVDRYQGGELSTYSNVFAHGDNIRETEEQGQPPRHPFLGAAEDSVSVAAAPRAHTLGSRIVFYPPGMTGMDPRMYYLFITGQLPPGTFTHASLSHDDGGNHYREAHYERFAHPSGPEPRLTETQEVSSDVPVQQPVQQPGHGRKGY